jgi:hypothetical protein
MNQLYQTNILTLLKSTINGSFIHAGMLLSLTGLNDGDTGGGGEEEGEERSGGFE